MRNKSRLVLIVLGVVLAIWAAAALAAEEKGKQTGQAMPPEMADWMKLAQPGEHHKHMAMMAGDWKVHSKMWMAPGAPPEEGDGSATVRPILDGRFFLSEFRGTVMGQPFQGMGLDGYDNYKQKHVGTWIDSMGTMILSFEGSCSEGGKVMEMKGTFEDPTTRKPSYMRMVSRFKDDKTILFESFTPGPDGKETKNMEMVYTRQ